MFLLSLSIIFGFRVNTYIFVNIWLSHEFFFLKDGCPINCHINGNSVVRTWDEGVQVTKLVHILNSKHDIDLPSLLIKCDELLKKSHQFFWLPWYW